MAVVEMTVVKDPVDPEAINVFVDGFVEAIPVRFLLDTGAGRCAVPLSDSTRDLMVTGRNSGVGVSGIDSSGDEVIMPRLRLGDLVVENVPSTRSSMESPLSALLGMTVLGRYVCEFNFGARELRLGEDRSSGLGSWFDLGALAGGQPLVTVHFESVVTTACWDTGAGLSVVDVEFAARHPQLFRPLRTTRAVDASGVEMRAQLCRMPACTVGGCSIAQSDCALIDLSALNATLETPMSLVLGMPAIVQADWTFDFPGHRWRAHPS